MFKNDIITAKDGKFTFPDLGDAYKEAIMLTFVAIEATSIDYARIKMYPDGKVNKYSLDNGSKAMLDIQKEVQNKSINLFDSTFQFEFSHGEIKKIESKFFKKDLEKYAYAINKMLKHIFDLTYKYNVPDETVKKLSDNAKRVHEKMYLDPLVPQIAEFIFQARVEISIKNGHGRIEGQAFGLIIVLYALKELVNNIDLDASEPTTLEFSTAKDELFFDASGNKKILNNIIDKNIIRIRGNLENVNNETYNKELGHILYHMINNLIDKRSNK